MSLPLLPHRSLSPDSVHWGEWTYTRGNQDPSPIPPSFADWDYTEELSLGVTMTEVDEPSLRDCVGNLDVPVLLVGVVDCRATLKRFIAKQTLRSGAASLAFQLPSGEVAGQITLTQHLVLGARQPTGGEDHSPRAMGSRLAASPSTTVYLEGGPTQFPTEALSFKQAGLEPVPWKLQFDTSDLSVPFLGAVRLWVNTDHAAGRALLDPTHSQFAALTSVVKRETIAHLIGSIPLEILTESDDIDPTQEADSILPTLDLLSNVWVGASLSESARLLHHDPVDFWTRTARRTKFLEEIS